MALALSRLDRVPTGVEQDVERVRHVGDSGDVGESVRDLGAARSWRDSQHDPASLLATAEIADGVDPKPGATWVHGHCEPRYGEGTHGLESEPHPVELLGIARFDLANLVDERAVGLESHATSVTLARPGRGSADEGSGALDGRCVTGTQVAQVT